MDVQSEVGGSSGGEETRIQFRTERNGSSVFMEECDSVQCVEGGPLSL